MQDVAILTYEEFSERITTWRQLITFAGACNYPIDEDIISCEHMNDIVKAGVNAFIDDGVSWQDIGRLLTEIPTGCEYYYYLGPLEYGALRDGGESFQVEMEHLFEHLEILAECDPDVWKLLDDFHPQEQPADILLNDEPIFSYEDIKSMLFSE